MAVKIYANARFGIRTKTLEEWMELNPVLAKGEPSYVSDGEELKWLKVGDGVTAWVNLPWRSGESVHALEQRVNDEFANAVKGAARGEIIRVDDVSPVEHTVKAKVRGENLANPNNIVRTVGVDVEYVEPKLRITKTNTENKWANIYIGLGDYDNFVGETLTASVCNANDYAWNMLLVALDESGSLINEIAGVTVRGMGWPKFTTNIPYIAGAKQLAIRIVSSDDSVATGEVYSLKYLHVGFGTLDAEYYVPYINPTDVTVTGCGKNLAQLTEPVAITSGMSVMAIPCVAKSPCILSYNVTTDSEGSSSAMIGVSYTDGSMTYDAYLSGAGTNTKQIIINNGKTINAVKILNWGNLTGTFNWLQVEHGNTATAYEPFTGGTYTPATDGTIDISSVSPTMTIVTDTPGVNIECEYNRDLDLLVSGMTAQLPPVTSSNNGQFLRVVDGVWTATTVANAEGASF